MEIKERNKGKVESKKSKGKFLKVSNESIFKSPTKSKSNIASTEFEYWGRLQYLRHAAIADGALTRDAAAVHYDRRLAYGH